MTSILTTISSPDNGVLTLDQSGHIILPPNLEFDDWRKALSQLRSFKGFYKRALGEVVSYGREAYGRDVVDATLEQLEFDLGDANSAIAYAQTIESVRVNKALTDEQKMVIGRALPNDPVKQAEWAKIAVDEALNPASLRVSIDAGHVISKPSRTPGIVSFEQVRTLFLSCQRQMSAALETLNLDEKMRIADILQPIVDLVVKLRD